MTHKIRTGFTVPEKSIFKLQDVTAQNAIIKPTVRLPLSPIKIDAGSLLYIKIEY